MKIQRNDKIQIITGKDRGKKGTVVRVLPKIDKVVVEGLNISKRHLKPSAKQPHGGIAEFAAPMSISNVMLICGACNKLTRAAAKITDDGKIRVCKHCGAALGESKKAVK
jgi:large subunit ribosomal protein L24